MTFDELETKMRVFETSHDHCVMPELYMVARLDGRGFTRLTKELMPFERPFDERFRDYMVATTEHLMDAGFRVLYGYTQSDEISLLLHLDEDLFGRKTRKYNSVLAGEASAKFSLLLGAVATFDCRICELPNARLVVDYFRWRHEDAHRNALSAHCYWALREQGVRADEASNRLLGMNAAAKNEFLFATAGLNFNDVPNWQKRGIGLYWERYEKEGLNPKTGERTRATRRRLARNFELPMKEEYDQFLRDFLQAPVAPGNNGEA